MTRVLLGVGGGIAAYKICQVASTLAQQGIEVRAVLTQAAQRFIAPLTFSTLCRHRAYTDDDFWCAEASRPLHIDLGEWADVMLIAPLTAHTLGKLVHGLADNLLTNTVLASTCPILLAPAMNTDMWQQAAVQRNWQQIGQDCRYHSVSPGVGRLACDRVGQGRMAEPAEILTYLRSLLLTQGQRDLVGKRILISAGSTHEYLDTVRFIGNPSTGRMGIALAQAASHRGADVTLVHGPIAADLLQTASSIHKIAVTSADEMAKQLLSQLPQVDWIVMAAAVADVAPAQQAQMKLPKAKLPDTLPLRFVTDIAAALGQRKQPHQRLIGFAAQTGEIVAPALDKLHKKQLDAIVANSIDQWESGFGSETNQAVFIDHQGHQVSIDLMPKLDMAHEILNRVNQLE